LCKPPASESPKSQNHTCAHSSTVAACETGKGWEICKAYCASNATFAAQAEPLADIKTLAEYADWMKGVTTAMPDSSYEVKSFATDTERNNVAAYAVSLRTNRRGGSGTADAIAMKLLAMVFE
jgi:hypothetical protein